MRAQARYESLLSPTPLEGLEAEYPQLDFRDLEDGDIMLQNTNEVSAWLRHFSGPFSPAGQMNLMHTAMVHKAWAGGVPGRCMTWEMLPPANIYPMQGDKRDSNDDTTDSTRMLIVRYTGEDKETVLKALNKVVATWYFGRKNFEFAGQAPSHFFSLSRP